MYISSTVLKTSDFSRVRSTNEDSVFNSRDMWYFFLIDRLYAICETPTEKGGAENAKTKIFSKSK